MPRTEFIADHRPSIPTTNDRPAIGFTTSLNPNRGCEYGCICRSARPYQESLGFSAGLVVFFSAATLNRSAALLTVPPRLKAFVAVGVHFA